MRTYMHGEMAAGILPWRAVTVAGSLPWPAVTVAGILPWRAVGRDLVEAVKKQTRALDMPSAMPIRVAKSNAAPSRTVSSGVPAGLYPMPPGPAPTSMPSRTSKKKGWLISRDTGYRH